MSAHLFEREDGFPIPAVTAEGMRSVDRIATERTGPDLLQMMENAGHHLAASCLRILRSAWKDAHVVVLAGSGGNGGGGICAARHLANRGVRVSLFLARPERLTGVPARQRSIFRAAAGEEVDWPGTRLSEPDLVVDALIGYGLRSAPRGLLADVIEWANVCPAPTVSLDVPSGVDATSGTAPGVAVRPETTLTLALPKTGLAAGFAGRLVLADIGIPAAAFREAGIAYVTPFDHRFRIPIRKA